MSGSLLAAPPAKEGAHHEVNSSKSTIDEATNSYSLDGAC